MPYTSSTTDVTANTTFATDAKPAAIPPLYARYVGSLPRMVNKCGMGRAERMQYPDAGVRTQTGVLEHMLLE